MSRHYRAGAAPVLLAGRSQACWFRLRRRSPQRAATQRRSMPEAEVLTRTGSPLVAWRLLRVSQHDHSTTAAPLPFLGYALKVLRRVGACAHDTESCEDT